MKISGSEEVDSSNKAEFNYSTGMSEGAITTKNSNGLTILGDFTSVF